MNKRLIKLFCILATSFSLCACSNSNNDIATDYYSDYYTHWAYDKDANEVGVGDHTFGKDHLCTVCGYEDPILQINEDGILMGLTEHGKSLTDLSLTDDITYISNDAFSGSKVENILIPSSVIGIGKDAYAKISKCHCDMEPSIDYSQKEDGDYVQNGFFDDDTVCIIGNTKYKSLDAALDDVDDDDTTIYLLKNDIKLSKTPDISLNVRLAKHPLKIFSSITITGNFQVLISGILEFGNSVALKGDVFLLIKNVNGNYSSGAVAFQDYESAPDGVTVRYVGDFISTNDKIVRGAKQTRNKYIIFPVNYFAYGALEFNKDFNLVTGLSAFGASCNALTITAPIEGIDAVIPDEGLISIHPFKIKFIKTFVDITMYVVDGIFSDLTIENGITTVNIRAFKSLVKSNLDAGLTNVLYALFSHMKSVTFGKDLTKICSDSFTFNKKLTTINGGCSLKEIYSGAFNECSKLKSVNLSEAKDLIRIDNSFSGCNILTRFLLPYSNGWSIGYDTFVFEDLTPQIVAKYATKNCSFYRNKKYDGKVFCVYNRDQVDENGIPNKVTYYFTLADAIKNMHTGETVRVLEDTDLGDTTFYIYIRINIRGSSTLREGGGTHLKCNFMVKRGVGSISLENGLILKGKWEHFD